MGPHGEVIAIRNGDLEQHVSAAVAYAVWQYWQATRDGAFLLGCGAEMLLETARFWASRARLEADGLHHIRNVIGPDEYHEGVDDNAYTNCMARWNIERGLETAALLGRRWPQHWSELATNLNLAGDELEAWRTVAASMFLPQDPAGLLEQFAGYFGLEDIDLSAFAARTAPLDVLLGAERTRRSQVIKQADVLMLMALLPDVFPQAVQERNFDYYEPRCGHGSSLSPPIYCLVAARLGRIEVAERYFQETAAIDLNDSMGNSAAGLHMGALGGLSQAAVFGFGGLRFRQDGLAFTPHLPEGWHRLHFPLRWRSRRLTVDISRERQVLEVSLKQGRPLKIYAGTASYRVEQGQPVVVPLQGEGWV
jgi:trehalose/maltose hydrolase-like predicted phosphorylase